MPELVEQMFCSQQIVIPPKFPYILKRYCKAAIKTQPYDLLRWSYEYFKALSQHRPPPVKLRLEYPVYSTEGGLTRGCLKVLAHQLAGIREVPLPVVKAAWQGFCLDPHELRRIFCLCEIYMRKETVPFLHFIAVAAGLLTKSLTHTMILLCESLTKEPDGGSAAISVNDFMVMYKWLARMDASKDVRYFNGFREGKCNDLDIRLVMMMRHSADFSYGDIVFGDEPATESIQEEESPERSDYETDDEDGSGDFWVDAEAGLQKLFLINASVARSTRLSERMNMPALGKIERSPSAERAGMIERDNYQRERKGRPVPSEDVNRKLRALSEAKLSTLDVTNASVVEENPKVETIMEKKEGVEIFVYDEDDNEIPYELYGEPPELKEEFGEEEFAEEAVKPSGLEEEAKEEEVVVASESEKAALLITELHTAQKLRQEDLEETFDEIAQLVDRFKSANYDLGMVAGRMMSTTSGEFIVQHIEKDIMAYIDEQIAILPDPDLKKKKAKPEEVAMIREILETFLDENMDVIVPEVEEVEEEEQPIPEITIVYAVPGIGPPVDEDIIGTFEEYALDVCKVQADVLMPRNIRHFLCPPLEAYEEYKYENNVKEEAPTSGVITD